MFTTQAGDTQGHEEAGQCCSGRAVLWAYSSAAHLLPPILTFPQPMSIAQAPRANPGGLYEADARQ